MLFRFDKARLERDRIAELENERDWLRWENAMLKRIAELEVENAELRQRGEENVERDNPA